MKKICSSRLFEHLSPPVVICLVGSEHRLSQESPSMGKNHNGGRLVEKKDRVEQSSQDFTVAKQ